jgi:uncharacterized protein YndB with AHSA1/START domain
VTSTKIERPKKPAAVRGSKISKKVWIKSSPEIVYKALTESRELVRWFCDRASCDPREGKELVASWKTGKSIQQGRALFTRVVPGSSLELLWVDDGDGERAEGSEHSLSYEIRSKSGMSELVMLDKDDSQSDEETCQLLDRGWNSVLLELKDYCERKERSAKVRAPAKSRSQKASRE